MQDYERLAELIGEIHDAALEPARWNSVLARISDFIGGQACGLVLKDPVTKFGSSPYNWGVDPHYVQLYADSYAKFDPLSTLPRIGHVVSIPDVVPYDEYRRGPFYNEYLQPQGWIDSAAVTLESAGSSPAVVLVAVPDKAKGMVDDEMRRRLALIAPHARRTVLIAKSMELKQTEAETFVDTLNGLSAGMFLVDVRGQIVHANAAGHDLLYVGDPLRSIGGRFATRNLHIDQTLREVFAAAAEGDAGIGAKAIALPLTAQDGKCYVAHVLPLTSGLRRATGVTYSSVAAVFVRTAELSPPQMIAHLYELTPAELRLLLAVAEFGGIPKTAEVLGVAETTVRTRLHRLYDKAGVSHQADLRELFAGFASPLVG